MIMKEAGMAKRQAVKDTVCPEINTETAKKIPHKDPEIAKKLLKILPAASFFLKSNEPIAPTAKKQSRLQNPFEMQHTFIMSI